jgi:acyl-CoA synthetase (AMP-forming)/AMP-acid ligase II
MIPESVAAMLACARIGVVSVPASAGDFLFLHVRRYPSHAAASGLRGFKERIRKVTISSTVRLRSQADV